MKALAEIKTNTKIEDLAMTFAGTEKYNSIVNSILQSVHFEVTEVHPFNGHPDNEKEFLTVGTSPSTYIATVIDLETDEIRNFKKNENKIVSKVIDVISSRKLDILQAYEFGNESHLYFNEE